MIEKRLKTFLVAKVGLLMNGHKLMRIHSPKKFVNKKGKIFFIHREMFFNIVMGIIFPMYLLTHF